MWFYVNTSDRICQKFNLPDSSGSDNIPLLLVKWQEKLSDLSVSSCPCVEPKDLLADSGRRKTHTYNSIYSIAELGIFQKLYVLCELNNLNLRIMKLLIVVFANPLVHSVSVLLALQMQDIQLL